MIFFKQWKKHLHLRKARRKQMLLQGPLHQPVMQKVSLPLQNSVRSWRFLLVWENLHSMSLNWPLGISGRRVFLAREGLVVCSRVGLRKMELHLWNLVLGLLLQSRPSTMMDCRVTKSGLYETYISFLSTFFLLWIFLLQFFFLNNFPFFSPFSGRVRHSWWPCPSESGQIGWFLYWRWPKIIGLWMYASWKFGEPPLQKYTLNLSYF